MAEIQYHRFHASTLIACIFEMSFLSIYMNCKSRLTVPLRIFFYLFFQIPDISISICKAPNPVSRPNYRRNPVSRLFFRPNPASRLTPSTPSCLDVGNMVECTEVGQFMHRFSITGVVPNRQTTSGK